MNDSTLHHNGRFPLNPHMLYSVLDGPALMPDAAEFPDNFIIRVSYATQAAALKPLLPRGFELAGPPVISFIYRHSENVDWIPRGELNMFGVTLAASFRGEADEASGAYWPVLWEDDAEAVILGRELMGVSKLHADIGNPRCLGGVWHCQLSRHGRPLIQMRFSEPRPAAQEELEAMRAQAAQARVLGWKVIPAPDAKGADLSYGTVYQSPNQIREAFFGTGEVVLHAADPKLDAWHHPIMESLRAVPLGKCLGAVLTRGSGVHLVTSGRRLR